ncbi:hypothetical protein CR513_56727, partial [Mucuna pruriens]
MTQFQGRKEPHVEHPSWTETVMPPHYQKENHEIMQTIESDPHRPRMRPIKGFKRKIKGRSSQRRSRRRIVKEKRKKESDAKTSGYQFRPHLPDVGPDRLGLNHSHNLPAEADSAWLPLTIHFTDRAESSSTPISSRLRFIIQRIYLEERLHQFQKEKDWATVLDVYGLLIYRVVLFPHLEDYVDLAAIDVFFAKRDKENPVIAVLANTYYTMNYCCKRNGKNKASKRTIRWYPKWNEREQVIVSCGGFLNVSLMGTQGGINYNLQVAARQAGYPMVLPPSKEATEPFIIHDMGVQNGECFKRIRHA